MKATKKLMSLVLALMMALSIMAVTAAAYGETGHTHDEACSTETIQPRKPAAWCPGCREQMTEVRVYKDQNGDYYSVLECRTNGCPNKGNPITLKW
ncbi:MAG: hypothetical protein K2N78_11740 [Oscillospiraceae bacterium]|nr:hypothetical protein [Oscillospiraceae bacterium]